MASKKELEAAVKAAEEAMADAMAAVNGAKDALSAAENRHRDVARAMQGARLALAQSAPLSKTALAFLRQAASECGHGYSPHHSFWRGRGGGKTADGITAGKLEALAFVEIRRNGHFGNVATATDAGRAKLAEATKKGGA